MCRIIAIDLTGVAFGRPLCFDRVAFGRCPSFFELERNAQSDGVYRFDNRKLACPPPPSSDTTWFEPDTVTDIEPETLYSLL